MMGEVGKLGRSSGLAGSCPTRRSARSRWMSPRPSGRPRRARSSTASTRPATSTSRSASLVRQRGARRERQQRSCTSSCAPSRRRPRGATCTSASSQQHDGAVGQAGHLAGADRGDRSRRRGRCRPRPRCKRSKSSSQGSRGCQSGRPRGLHGTDVASDHRAARQVPCGRGATTGWSRTRCAKRAIATSKLEPLADAPRGPERLGDPRDRPGDPAKVLIEFAKDHKNLKIHGGFVDGRVVDVGQLETLAKTARARSAARQAWRACRRRSPASPAC